MRMRKKKNGEARLFACRPVLADKPEAPLTDPGSLLGRPGAPVWLEIGAGKGGFAAKTSALHAEVAYFAMERISDCVLLGAEHVMAHLSEREDNLRFLVDNAENLPAWFAFGAVDRIFLNFSDPWPKKGYAKRRLTHRRFLSLYFNLLREGGELTFKTDNTGLFDFTLEELGAVGLFPETVTRDLHASPYAAANVMTEYETAFVEKGEKICMLSVKKPVGYTIPFALDEARKDGQT